MADSSCRRLLYFSPAFRGGLADYAHEQAQALGRCGVRVTLLTAPQYPYDGNNLYEVRRMRELGPEKQDRPSPCPLLDPLRGCPGEGILPFSSLFRKLAQARAILRMHATLARTVRQEGFRHVLLGSYAEYLAPLWARPLRKLAKQGVTFGTVVHDPVRDFVVGPRWWHRWSIASAYSFVREAFVHEPIELDTGVGKGDRHRLCAEPGGPFRQTVPVPLSHLRTTVIPHGPYPFAKPRRSREEVRAELEIPASAPVLLAFGHVRDGKNLDLALKALARWSPGFSRFSPDLPAKAGTPTVDDVYLIVAGKVTSTTQRPIDYYQAVARDTGVAGRCRWIVDFIPAEQVADLFNACDGVLLTYSAAFRSASGVLSTAVAYRRPCIASAGEGNLRSMVQKYGLGVFVEPDDTDAIRCGIQQWLSGVCSPQWEDYERDNSWEKNAEIVCSRMWDSGA